MQTSTFGSWVARISMLMAASAIILLGSVIFHRVHATTGTAKLASLSYHETTGTELVMLVIGSSTCAASMNDSLPTIVASLDSSLSRRADSLGLQFATMGVAIDHTPAAGMSFLSRFHHLDEVATGRNWLNSAAITYLWRDMPGRAGLPQVLLVERPIEVDTKTIRVGQDRLIARVVGVDSLRIWADKGAPWDTPDSSSASARTVALAPALPARN